jgi:hypothetical protein
MKPKFGLFEEVLAQTNLFLKNAAPHYIALTSNNYRVVITYQYAVPLPIYHKSCLLQASVTMQHKRG